MGVLLALLSQLVLSFASVLECTKGIHAQSPKLVQNNVSLPLTEDHVNYLCNNNYTAHAYQPHLPIPTQV